MSFALDVADLLTANFTLLDAKSRRQTQTSRLESCSEIAHDAIAELDGVIVTLNCDAKMVVGAKGRGVDRIRSKPRFCLFSKKLKDALRPVDLGGWPGSLESRGLVARAAIALVDDENAHLHS